MAALTGFVGLTASISAIASGRRRAERALGQLVIGFLLLALLTGDAGLAAIAVEAAMLAAAWLVRGGSAAAGRRVLVVGGASAALALVGIVLMAGASGGLAWRDLAAAAPGADSARLGLGFAFVLTGYGALATLIPPQAWLPTAIARAPAPVAVLLAGALPNVPLVLLLRLREVLAAHPGGLPPGPLLLAAGLIAVLLAAVELRRGRLSVRRLTTLATVGQSGVAAFAFGLGGVAATFAGLLHLVLGTLARIAALHGTGARRIMPGPRGLRAAPLLALAGLPPFGPFASLFLVLLATIDRAPWLALPLGAGVVIGMGAILGRLPTLLAPDPVPGPYSVGTLLRLAPAWLPLAVAVVLGLAMPGIVAAWLRDAAAVAR
jgi:hydrogenase-4 component F